MNQPSNNPITNPSTNGRRVRHVRMSTSIQTFRTDAAAEATLELAKERLAGTENHDRPSVSLIVRRALVLYRRHLAGLVGTPQGIRNEQTALWIGSRLPRLRK